MAKERVQHKQSDAAKATALKEVLRLVSCSPKLYK